MVLHDLQIQTANVISIYLLPLSVPCVLSLKLLICILQIVIGDLSPPFRSFNCNVYIYIQTPLSQNPQQTTKHTGRITVSSRCLCFLNTTLSVIHLTPPPNQTLTLTIAQNVRTG